MGKKVARNEKLLKEKTARLAELKKDRAAKRHQLKMNAQQYEREYALAEKHLISMRRTAKQAGQFFVEPEAKLIFCIRIAGINKISQLLRLRQLHNGVWLKVNRPIINMLRYVATYVTFGYPNLKSVRELIYKRGYGKVNKCRVPLTDNEIIQKELGEKSGINGMEDLVHEIYTVGPNFKAANNFLWPFKLNAPRG